MPGGALVVSVVVPTYNRPDRAERLLAALSHQSLPPRRFEVIVVDNHSADDTSARLSSLIGTTPYRLRVLRTPYNRGPALARNTGWRAAEAPLVAFTDDDCVPEPTWLAAAAKRFADEPDLGVLQGRTAVPPEVDVTRVDEWTVCRFNEGPTPHFEGCNVIYRRSALEETGGFDEDIGWYGEDAACGWRVVERGWGRGYEPTAVVHHDVEVRGWRWYVRNSYLEQNLVWVAAKHPGFRRECFWRPWAVQPEGAMLAAGVVGLAAARWWKPLALAAVPYLWHRRLALRQPRIWGAQARVAMLDAVRSAGHVVGSVRHRVFVV